MPTKLIALTPEARRALNGAELVLPRLPFRMGRESRTGSAAPRDAERRGGAQRQVNDVYITEDTQVFNVSREHVLIESDGQRFTLTDLGSACGTIVEGKVVGGNRAGGTVDLHDYDVIVVGTAQSPFVFKFRTA